jgi:hypothetical protein
MTRTATALLAALASASCGAPLMKLPAGPYQPSSDAADVLTQATRACRTVSTITAEILVRGSVGGRRLRARLLAGLAAPDSARLEAPAPFGQPLLILVTRASDATLLLPRDGRVLEHGRPEAILEALTGVSLSASELRMTLTGCAEQSAGTAGRQSGAEWRIMTGSTNEVYLQRVGEEPWRVVAALHRGSPSVEWRAEFRDFHSDLPRTIHLVSADRRKFDLTLALSQVDVNTTLEPDTFRVTVPKGLKPITIEELQRNGPIAADGVQGSSTASRDAASARSGRDPRWSIDEVP